MDFHYLIVADEQRSSVVRHVEVFLDEKAFSEENLKKLFAHLSPKYPATRLIIEVFTDWNQLPLPSDCPGAGTSNMPDRPDLYDYHQAIYYNLPEREYFRYNPTKKIHSSEFKTVVLKLKEKQK
jgi:hypothetical protein